MGYHWNRLDEPVFVAVSFLGLTGILYLEKFYAPCPGIRFYTPPGLPYQITEEEDPSLPQRGILPISAKKTITIAKHRCLEKDSPHCVQ